MISSTKDYDMFIFREDNRAKIDRSHVKRLIESIKARNLLELRPIIVNDMMEILDGQHRLLAAKELNVAIYYQKEKNLDHSDMVRMNVAKNWRSIDYLNYYCHHRYPEYIKLREFMKKHNLHLKIALNMNFGNSKSLYEEFKSGNLKFNADVLDTELAICWDTIDLIKKMNGYSPYVESSRFWSALLKLVRYPEFDSSKWITNMKKMISHFCTKAKTEEYLITFQNIYNWRSTSKINLVDTL